MRTQDLQFHLQLRSTVQSILNNLMAENQVSAIDMQEAVEHYLVGLQEAASAEYMNWMMQEKALLEAKLQEIEEKPQEVIIEEE